MRALGVGRLGDCGSVLRLPVGQTHPIYALRLDLALRMIVFHHPFEERLITSYNFQKLFPPVTQSRGGTPSPHTRRPLHGANETNLRAHAIFYPSICHALERAWQIPGCCLAVIW